MKSTGILFIFIVCVIHTYSQDHDSTLNIKPKKTAPWFVERFRLSAGLFVPVNNTSIQVGIKGGAIGTEIDFEKDLGFGKTDFTFLANFQWRISRRSRLNLNYYNIPRNSTHTLQKDITFGDNTYPVNATV
jgi:hypothetical protein